MLKRQLLHGKLDFCKFNMFYDLNHDLCVKWYNEKYIYYKIIQSTLNIHVHIDVKTFLAFNFQSDKCAEKENIDHPNTID